MAPPARLPQPDNRPAIETTFDEIDRDYRNNEIAAQGKYGNYPLIVSGAVSQISINGFGQRVVMFHARHYGSPDGVAMLAPGQDPVAAKLHPGSEATVGCAGAEYVTGGVMLSHCLLEAY